MHFKLPAIMPLMLFAASRMQSLRSPGWAKAGSIAAMLPVGISFVIGLPAGIWSLVVLHRQEVQDAFAIGAKPPAKPQSSEPLTDWSPLVFGLVLVVPLIALMAFGIVFTRSAWVLGALNEAPRDAFAWVRFLSG